MSADSRTEPRAAPRTTVAPGAPASACVPSISLATIVATVTAAIWPVLPSATPATSPLRTRRRPAVSSGPVRGAIGPRYGSRRVGATPSRCTELGEEQQIPAVAAVAAAADDHGDGGEVRRDARRGSRLLGGDLDEAAERVHQPHLLGCPARDPEQLRARDDDGEPARPGHGDVEAVPRVEELEVARSVVGRRRRPRGHPGPRPPAPGLVGPAHPGGVAEGGHHPAG